MKQNYNKAFRQEREKKEIDFKNEKFTVQCPQRKHCINVKSI